MERQETYLEEMTIILAAMDAISVVNIRIGTWGGWTTGLEMGLQETCRGMVRELTRLGHVETF